MITEDYCSFETAKLLKGKGFDETCYACYEYFSSSVTMYSGWPFEYKGEVVNNSKNRIKCPTHQMACKWLREKYNIYISIHPDFPSDKDYKMCWCWSASILHENCISIKGYQCYIETYEEATETAIKYSLKNLI